jgi:hypothetical protein
MKYLINKIVIVTCMLLTMIACVDDFEDANPARLLDAPAVSSTQSANAINVVGGEEVVLTIAITDAPAGLASVSVVSKEDTPEFTSNISSLVGQNKGTVTVNYTVPYTNIGAFAVNVGILDNQTDEDGEDASKTSAVTFNMIGSYAFDAPVFTVAATNAELLQGESTPFSIIVTTADGGGIARVSASTDVGSFELDESSVAAALGKGTATVTGTFTAPDAVGSAVITAFVEDVLQVRSNSSSTTVEVVYECDEADFDFNLAESELILGGSTEFTITLNDVACNVAEITFEMTDDDGNVRGSVAVDDADIAALVGQTNGVLVGEYTADASLRSTLDIKVTIVDEDGQATVRTAQIVIGGCNASSLAGSYTTLTSGTSTDGCPINNPIVDLGGTVTIVDDGAGNYTVDDIFAGIYIEWYGACYGYTFATAGTLNFCQIADGVSLVTFDEGFGSTVTDTGSSYDSGTGQITVSWANGFGDTATSVFTPL